MFLWACRLRPLSGTENKIYYFYDCGQNTLNLFLFSLLFMSHIKSNVCCDSVAVVHFLHNIISCYLDTYFKYYKSIQGYIYSVLVWWCHGNGEILQLVVGRAKANKACAVVMLGHREGLRVWDVSFVSNSALVIVSNPCSITHIRWYIDCHGCAVPSSTFFRKLFRAKQKVSFNQEFLGLEFSGDLKIFQLN